jgi:hypothetical protein
VAETNLLVAANGPPVARVGIDNDARRVVAFDEQLQELGYGLSTDPSVAQSQKE